jgi:DNA-binding SARP family transcriptional activator
LISQLASHRQASGPAEGTRISILGPCELVGPRGVVRFTARRQQIVLATLVWNANRVVPIESLIDAMWGSCPPGTARSQVHISVSHIRQRLARHDLHHIVETAPPGYVARVGHDELDLNIFDELVRRGRGLIAEDRLDEANTCFAEALRLWRGEPFAGVESDRIRSIAAQISERRVAISEENFDVQIRLGRGAEVVPDLMALVDDYPFRERLRAQLMLALCQTGRYVEALSVYRDTRKLFIRELGMEPGWELRKLEHDILSGTPTGVPSVRETITTSA